MPNLKKRKKEGVAMCNAKRWYWVELFSVLIIFISTGWVEQAQSQEKYPTKPIEIINPFSPGGSTDLWSRIAAGYLNKKWGVPVNVVNKPGGNTLPACMQVYKAPPDGYTLLSDSTGSSTMLGIVVMDLPIKVMDRTFLAITGITPSLLIVPANSPYKTLADVIADAKKDPQNFTWSSLGGASSRDLSVRQFFRAIGVDFKKTKPVMSRVQLKRLPWRPVAM
jgi:tripartite-type tricarboxylate transporter receptor subunit TctC